MTDFEKSQEVLKALYSKDCNFVLATSKDNIPSARVVDTYYDGKYFWIVTHALSNKVKEIEENPNAALCSEMNTLKGTAVNTGHPLAPQNKEIRERLIKEFEVWYFAHNNEEDENMCYVRFTPKTGLYHKDGTAYNVNFEEKTATTFPFTPGF